MTWPHGCPRCNGDPTEQTDEYGRYVVCIQCGYELTAAEEVVVRYAARLNAGQPLPPHEDLAETGR